MTDAPLDGLAAFLRSWVETLARVLQQISGAVIPCTMLMETPFTESSQESDELWLLTSLSGGLRGELCIRIPRPAVTILGQLFLGETAGASGELAGSEHAEAVLELIRQVGGLVATAVNSSWGEVHIHVDRASGAPSWPASSTAWLRAGEGGAVFEVQISAALAAALRSDDRQELVTPGNVPSAKVNSSESEVKLDLLMDVELAITLRFGGRRMLLREILNLNSGSVVELDRKVNDPVDVLLDGHVVARGEVVVVDGNYGLRITQIGSGV